MDDAILKKLKPCLCILAAILLEFMVFSCTRSVVNLARRNCHWGWWSWTPCFFNVYLLIEVILSQNKTALITSCALIAVDLLADAAARSGLSLSVCHLMSSLPSGRTIQNCLHMTGFSA